MKEKIQEHCGTCSHRRNVCPIIKEVVFNWTDGCEMHSGLTGKGYDLYKKEKLTPIIRMKTSW